MKRPIHEINPEHWDEFWGKFTDAEPGPWELLAWYLGKAQLIHAVEWADTVVCLKYLLSQLGTFIYNTDEKTLCFQEDDEVEANQVPMTYIEGLDFTANFMITNNHLDESGKDGIRVRIDIDQFIENRGKFDAYIDTPVIYKALAEIAEGVENKIRHTTISDLFPNVTT
ncbi:hypothetical protein [uncultured Duncaniella sp.]|uniref:hypothetical protein n=1 Tax=uncultured Duncaniella sp. TaxID=2768039 RepID=UPI002617BDC4|nr:hypothetical protein [uncultured Duncaniella sp.]